MISAVVLTHNDESTLSQTLESVTWCDEIIIIDDFSTDQTVEIAKKYTSKIHVHALENDFSKQRNFGLTKARGEWVFFVDSDEVVNNVLAQEIQQAVTSGDGYYLKRKDFIFGRWLNHGETSKVKLLRLGKKAHGIWQRPVHEVWNISGVVRTLRSPLLHFPHPNVAQFIEEINQYSTINARYFFAKNIRVSWWHIIVYPKLKFLKNYFWNLGFLDGTAGAVVAIMMSLHSFLTRAKLWLLRHTP